MRLEVLLADQNFVMENIVVGRYVRSLYAVSVEQKKEEEFLQQIYSIRSFLNKMPNRDKLLKKFSFISQEGEEFVRSLSDDLHLLPQLSNFLKLLIKNRRLAALPEICKYYDSFYQKKRGKKVFYITYANNKSIENKNDLFNQLRNMFTGYIEFVEKEDPTLMGGFQIRYQSKLLDYSLKSKLSRLERVMKGESL